MRKAITVTMLVAFVWTILVQDIALALPPAETPPAQSRKYSLAVVDMEASGRVSVMDARKLTERLSDELRKTGLFEVLAPEQVSSTLQSSNFNISGCSTAECAIQAGKLLGVKLVANGSISKVGPLYFTELQIVHVKSGEIVQRVRDDFEGDFSQLQDHIPVLVRKLIGEAQPRASSTGSLPPANEPAATRVETAGNFQATEEQTAAAAPSDDFFDSPSTPTAPKKNGSSKKIMLVGLLAAGVGAGVLISQALKKDDGGEGNGSVPDGSLPNPPDFP